MLTDGRGFHGLGRKKRTRKRLINQIGRKPQERADLILLTDEHGFHGLCRLKGGKRRTRKRRIAVNGFLERIERIRNWARSVKTSGLSTDRRGFVLLAKISEDWWKKNEVYTWGEAAIILRMIGQASFA